MGRRKTELLTTTLLGAGPHRNDHWPYIDACDVRSVADLFSVTEQEFSTDPGHQGRATKRVLDFDVSFEASS